MTLQQERVHQLTEVAYPASDDLILLDNPTWPDAQAVQHQNFLSNLPGGTTIGVIAEDFILSAPSEIVMQAPDGVVISDSSLAKLSIGDTSTTGGSQLVLYDQLDNAIIIWALNNTVTFNNDSLATNFVFKGATDSKLFFINGTTDSAAIGTDPNILRKFSVYDDYGDINASRTFLDVTGYMAPSTGGTLIGAVINPGAYLDSPNLNLEGLNVTVKPFSEVLSLRGIRIDVAGWTGKTNTLDSSIGFWVTTDVEDHTVTSAYNVFSDGPNVDAGTVTNAYNTYLLVGTKGTGTITNDYALYIDAVNRGATSSYAIYTNAGLISFGDDLEFRQGATISTTTGNLNLQPAGTIYAGVYLGVFSSNPQTRLHVRVAGTETAPGYNASQDAIVIQRSGTSSTDVGMAITAGDLGKAFIKFGDDDAFTQAQVRYFNETGILEMYAGNSKIQIEDTDDIVIDAVSSVEIGAGNSGESAQLVIHEAAANVNFVMKRQDNDIRLKLTAGFSRVEMGSLGDHDVDIQTFNTTRLRIDNAGDVWTFQQGTTLATSSGDLKLEPTGGTVRIEADNISGTQLVIRGNTDTNKRFYLGYDTNDDRCLIQAIHEGTAYRPIWFIGSQFEFYDNTVHVATLYDATLRFEKGFTISTTADALTLSPAGALILNPGTHIETADELRKTNKSAKWYLYYDAGGDASSIYLDTPPFGSENLRVYATHDIVLYVNRSGATTGSEILLGESADQVILSLKPKAGQTAVVSGNGGDLYIDNPGADVYVRVNTVEQIKVTSSDMTFTPPGDLIMNPTGYVLTKLPHGSMYNHDTTTTVTITTQNVWVRVPSGFTAGQNSGTTFQNSREIKVDKAGKYKIDWSLSIYMASGASQEIEGGVGINNTINTQTTAHRSIGTATDRGNMGGTCILDLSLNDVVSLMVVNETSTNNVVVEHANLSLVRIG